MPTRTLREVLPDELLARLPAGSHSVPVTGVTADSRQVGPGSIFVAVRGGTQDGHQFLEQAARRGAVLLIGQAAQGPASAGVGPELGSGSRAMVPYLQVPDSRLALSQAAAGFHGHPSRKLVMVGVTGTSGKTTTTYLLEAILKAAGHEPGLIGTVAVRYKGRALDSTHTTPGPVELQKILADMLEADCTAAVMEVSSHALRQHRAAGVAFNAMVFTNLSPEHLDFHPDMEDYYQAKAMLFRELARSSADAGKQPVAAINSDDEYGRRLLTEVTGPQSALARCLAYSVQDRKADVSGAELFVSLDGIRGAIGGQEVRSPLTGLFNVSNVLGAWAAAAALGIPPDRSAEGVSRVTVPGRLERVPDPRGANGVNVLVDYAHKSDAFEKVLQTLRAVKGSCRLITVFGCGGDRDRIKRPVMGRLAEQLSDRVYVTSDNPRTEDPGAIIQEILKGTQAQSHLTAEPDRRKAIFQAIAGASPGDVVLIAGKGHEDYQIIADPGTPTRTRKIHFDDREVAAEALRARPS